MTDPDLTPDEKDDAIRFLSSRITQLETQLDDTRKRFYAERLPTREAALAYVEEGWRDSERLCIGTSLGIDADKIDKADLPGLVVMLRMTKEKLQMRAEEAEAEVKDLKFRVQELTAEVKRVKAWR